MERFDAKRRNPSIERQLTMKKSILSLLAVGALTCGLFSQQSQAASGSISFVGSAKMDSTTVDTATKVTAWYWAFSAAFSPQVAGATGDFSSVAPGTFATFAAPWSFVSGPIASFWSVGGFTFDLISSSIFSQGAGTVSVTGTGTISGGAFGTGTAGTWMFTANDPNLGTPRSTRFAFSAGTTAAAIPDGGSAVALLGIALAGIEGARRLIGSRKA